ncbi:hypothetical protein [Chromatocurvus halotolerans]|uniref:Uncharacterized protein n=1 Tax=Chromatocurvus halotolerans TaxID=1132028 RepID=A0A4R2KJB6_9GAMM|nr:hypothetical protein [Chromatocurvus halotolerans]TCO72612.1 hypothetical protein EV688_11839 [Chromatocurvus halotolerans]
MRILRCAVLVAAMGAAASHADCEAPDEPNIPDGANASMQDMLDGQESVKTFQAANMDYLRCLEAAFTEAEKTAKNAEEKTEAARAMVAYSKAVEAYNAAVSKEESVAGEFNTQIREYQARSADK